MARSKVWTLTLGLVVVTGAAIAAEPTRMSLYYKVPARQPLTYFSTMEETVLSKNIQGYPEQTSYRTEQTISNLYKLVSPDTLAVKAKFSGLKTFIGGKEVSFNPQINEAQRLMDVKGYRKTFNKSAKDFDKFDVILPKYPVAIGEAWTYTAPPTSDLPLFLVTRYKVARVEKQGSHDVAVIEATTNVSEIEPLRRLKITVVARGQIVFAVAEGVLVSSTFKIDMITEPLASKSGRITKRIKTSMRLTNG